MRIKSKYLIAPLLLLLFAFHVDKRVIHGRWYTSPDGKQLAYETEYHGFHGEPRDVFVFSFDFGVRYFPYVRGTWQWSPDSQYFWQEYNSLSSCDSEKVIRLKNNETVCEFCYDRYNPCGPLELENGDLWSLAYTFNFDYPRLKGRQVMAGVYVITYTFPSPGNSLLVLMPGVGLLLDTPYTPEATQHLLQWFEWWYGEPDIVAINTGYHYENLGGNAYLLEQGIPVYGSDLTVQLLEERGDAMRAMSLEQLRDPKDKAYYDVYQSLPLVAPDHVFPLKEGLQLQFGDEIVEVYYPGPSHAPDNVVVYFPDRKLLYGGSVIIGEDSLGDTTDADMATWPEAVRTLSRFDVKMIISGHGERLGPRLLEHTLELLNEQ